MSNTVMTSNHQSALAKDAPPEQVTEAIEDVHRHYLEMRKQLAQVIVGMDDVAEELMIAILCRGHCILQGMPGLAKTLLISRIASLMHLTFHRIQFTPDLMPADITGSEVLEEDRTTGRREFRFIKGPVFANIVLADEVNRTPPKSQSALLEAMEERQLSLGGKTYRLPDPFFVLATQNPVEVEGTYPLPEAQLDRFLFKIKVSYPSRDAEREICRRNVTDYSATTKTVIDEATLKQMQGMVTKVIVSDHVYNAALDLVRSTRPEEGMLPKDLREMVQWGAGPRASIALLMAAKARALLQKRVHATTEDVWASALPVLRHRIIPTFKAEAAGVDNDKIVTTLIQQCRKTGVK
jgi:MoxR-like ATPase